MSLRNWYIIFLLVCSAVFFASDNRELSIAIAIPDNSKVNSEEKVIKLTKKEQFGFTKSIYDFYEDEYFHITVWRLGDNDDGLLVADGISDYSYYYGQNKPSAVDTNNWQLLTLDIHIPPHHHFSELRIYVWNSGTNDVFFRDLNIERRPQKKYPVFKQPALEISIDSTGMRRLKAIRNTAFRNSILETGANDYVKAKLIYGNDTMKARIRLKGDLLDHLIGSKWSFRIKMRKDDSWKNMRNFSLQSPQTRGFLDEWFTHKIFASEDVLTTRYGFVPVVLNGRSLGIYAYEEHFDKQLIEYNNRREGPILKFSEELLFTVQKLNNIEGKDYHVPFFNASDILPFKENRTLNNKILYDEFLIAQNLLYQFKNDLKPVSGIFDMKSLAKYYALSDLTGAYHGFKWHNIRFYYNPVLCRLEPVAYDCYPLSGIEYGENFHMIIETFRKSETIQECDNMLFLPLKQNDFRRDYLYNLTRFSRLQFLDSIYNSLASELDSLAELIKKEFDYYHFDINPYKANCKEIKGFLAAYNDTDSRHGYFLPEVHKNIVDQNLSDEFIPFLIKIFKNQYTVDSVIYIHSYYPEIITFTGYGNMDKVLNYKIHPVNIPGEAVNFSLKIDNPEMAKYLFFKPDHSKKNIAIKVFKWNMPYNYSPLQELSERFGMEYQTFFKENGSTLIIEGKFRISKPVIIPAGYHVIINPGTELNLLDNSTFISYSPVFIMGTAEEPVLIYSADGTAMGFNVFQSGRQSKLEYVVFDQLNALGYNGWTLTGAVNFYESDVEMKNTAFKNNRCEDALNIIRSEFEMKDCTFDNIYADAFDSDFSTGTLENSLFRDIANDAMDFSGSKVLISNCEVYHSGDKAISSGERSEIWIENVKINHANVAIASKDLSSLTISNSLILNSDYSFIAFKKKPEFGSAEIHVKRTALKNIMKGRVIEQGSVIYVDDIAVPGTGEKVAKRFYINK